jgi:monoamine oxidase
MEEWDLIIVGGGISGLWLGREVLRKYKGLKVLILEKYDYLGGRVVTRYGKEQWEIGAGRIAENHKMVLGLIKEYGLTFAPIGGGSDWIDKDGKRSDNMFEELIETYMSPLKGLSTEVLGSNTLAELLERVHGAERAADFYRQFPYWAEIHNIRGDLGLKSFFEEMGGKVGFGVCVEGLSKITDGLASDFERLGGESRLGSEVVDINYKKGIVILKDKEELKGKMIVSCLHCNAMKNMKTLYNNMPVLKKVDMSKLVRMYAVFPKVWWTNKKTICEKRIRYIIPISAKQKSIMISYTDGDEAEWWINLMDKKGKDEVQKQVMKEVREIFGEEVPEPSEFKIYPWTDGCTYWKPGRYVPWESSIAVLKPFAGYPFFVCGESFSLRQAWMEGALEHTEQLFSHPGFIRSIKKCLHE